MNFHISDIFFLIGKWKGSGYAQFPTIEPVEYNEEMNFSSNLTDAVLFYEQRSWISSGDNAGMPIYWESGFIIHEGENQFSLSNSQKSGRVEVCRGKISNDQNSWKLTFENEMTSDARLERITREYIFNNDELSYKLNMKMKSVEKHQNHLRAFLKKER
ncbi:hypothetical protein BH10BAC5_BH10BAC5_22500 [soil metagenome]